MLYVYKKKMNLKVIKTSVIIFFFFIFTSLKAEIVNKIEISGNDRISNETIQMFSTVSLKDNIDDDVLNLILKNLYETNFFDNVSIKFKNNTLIINVKESPIIQNVYYEGIKAKKIKDKITKNLNLKPRSSFNKLLIKKDIEILKNSLQELGYYFSEVDVFTEDLSDNMVDLKYLINIGEKGRIKKISFIGNKIFKDKKLKSLILSEEYKFWKFISGKKYLNKNLISLDKRLLKNFYLNKGFFNAQINTSFAKLVNTNEFELIFNIDSGEKFYFNNLVISLPNDFDEKNFEDLNKIFLDLKGEPYSLNRVAKILEQIDLEKTLVILSSDHGEYIPITGEEITEIPKIQKTINSATKKAKFAERAGLKSLIFLRFVAQTYRKEKLKRTVTPYEMRSFNTRAALDLYDETINVPLIFSGANIKSKELFSELVRHVDIFPTIVDLIGIKETIVKQNGQSLVPLINGEKFEEKPAYIEVGINLAQLIDDKNAQIEGKIIGIRTSNHKYLRDRKEKDKQVRLFNLKDDPLEENNIAEKNPEIIKEMEEILTKLESDHNTKNSDSITDDEVKKAKDILLKLGYI